MTQWLPAALLALFSFGLWGLFSKLAIAHIDSKSALIFQTAGVLIVGIITLSMLNFKPETDMKGLSFGLLTGIAYGVGCLFYLIAADKGKIITIVTLTALYPLVTIVLSYFLLQETISLRQVLGILLALIAIFFMSS
ncbi:MAG: EamA family transporter [Gammaproteobacteria bacterium]|nr:EamA family transporter [Gammaproteobacteria bacterium]MCW5583413.1 EamA family transporter [Gammaproteobacteria bacterium]